MLHLYEFREDSPKYNMLYTEKINLTTQHNQKSNIYCQCRYQSCNLWGVKCTIEKIALSSRKYNYIVSGFLREILLLWDGFAKVRA